MATAKEWVEREPEGEAVQLPVSIRPAAVEDAEAISAIEALSFTNPWHPQTFRSLISQKRAHVLVAEEGELGVVGYAVAWWVMDQGELANLAVTEGLRGRGIGSALLDRVLTDARDHSVETLFLEVRMSNDPAFRLYLSRGFVQVAIRKDYYRRPREDARVLLKDLAG